jgi:hypothetical protein
VQQQWKFPRKFTANLWMLAAVAAAVPAWAPARAHAEDADPERARCRTLESASRSIQLCVWPPRQGRPGRKQWNSRYLSDRQERNLSFYRVMAREMTDEEGDKVAGKVLFDNSFAHYDDVPRKGFNQLRAGRTRFSPDAGAPPKVIDLGEGSPLQSTRVAFGGEEFTGPQGVTLAADPACRKENPVLSKESKDLSAGVLTVADVFFRSGTDQPDPAPPADAGSAAEGESDEDEVPEIPNLNVSDEELRQDLNSGGLFTDNSFGTTGRLNEKLQAWYNRLKVGKDSREFEATYRDRFLRDRNVRQIFQIFREAKVPVALAFAIVAIESHWKRNVRCSNRGACGMFQFIPSTARRFGVNRADPISSARGAARYLRQLAEEFAPLNGGKPNWLAAIASYHGGKVAKAARISRSGDMSEIYRVMPPLSRYRKDVENYLPNVLALITLYMERETGKDPDILASADGASGASSASGAPKPADAPAAMSADGLW